MSDVEFYKGEQQRNRKHLRDVITFRYDLTDDERILLVRGLVRLRDGQNSTRIADLMDKLLNDEAAVAS